MVLKELVLKELLLQELLLSPTRDCDISVFCRCWKVADSPEDYGFKAEDLKDISSAR